MIGVDCESVDLKHQMLAHSFRNNHHVAARTMSLILLLAENAKIHANLMLFPFVIKFIFWILYNEPIFFRHPLVYET